MYVGKYLRLLQVYTDHICELVDTHCVALYTLGMQVIVHFDYSQIFAEDFFTSSFFLGLCVNFS